VFNPCSVHLNAASRLKWKAPSENSIDFKLELRFPPLAGRPNDPDFAAKPAFKLLAYYGDDRTTSGRREGRYEYFDLMDVSDEEWEQCVAISLRLVRPLIRFCVTE
jgi:mRNA guanylyltransferase